MAIQVQSRRGTTTAHATFTGAPGEITVDTTKNVVVVHDGVTAGGHPAGSGGASTATDVASTPAGTLSATNVQAALNELDVEKQAVSAKDASNGYVGLSTFRINLRNAANTITSWFTTAATVARTWTFPDKDGTVAMTSDITGINSGTNTGDQTDITGNAGTVTNGVYTVGDQTIVGLKSLQDSLRIGVGQTGEKSAIFHNAARYVHLYLNDSGIFGLWDYSSATDRFSTDTSGNFTAAGNLAAANLSGTNTGNQTASTVSFTPTGTIAATNVQAAIAEVAAEAGGGTAYTYTGSSVGLSTVVNATVKYTVTGNVVTMDLPNMYGTSNSTAFAITGGPVNMRPATAKAVLVRIRGTTDSNWYPGVDYTSITGAQAWAAGCAVIETTGQITIYRDPAGSSWASTDTNKGLGGCSISYTLA